jgi:Insertion element 4 transposase N-terminal/Transposase DDE domain
VTDLESLGISGRLTDHLSIGVLAKTVPRFIIDEVLAETDRKEKRSRLLPAHVVVYFVMALALFRDGYDEVIRALVHGLRFARTWSTTWQVPTTGAISQARVRLGESVMRELFVRVAQPLAGAGTPGAWLGPWRLMAIDGVMLDIPETDANLAVYEKAVGGTRRPYPQVKIVGLGECGTHALIDATIGSIRHGERELAEPLTRSLEANMLLMADRGFFSYTLWRAYLLTGAQLLWRLTKTTHLPVLQVLPDGSYLSEIKSFRGPGKTRIPLDKIADPMLATHIPVRVIEYQVQTGDGLTHLEVFRLITTILDPDQADAHELAACYAQRWEFESSLREIETQLLEPGSTLRSKTPEMVRQEIWGLFLTHYTIRAFMKEAVDTTDLDPDRLSTIRAINIIRRSVTDPAAFSPHHENPEPPAGDR